MVNRFGRRHAEYLEGLCRILGGVRLRDVPARTAQPKICGGRVHSSGGLFLQVSRLFQRHKVALGSVSNSSRERCSIPALGKARSLRRVFLITECEPPHTARKKRAKTALSFESGRRRETGHRFSRVICSERLRGRGSC